MTTTGRSRSCRFGPLFVEYDDRVLSPRQWTLEQSRWAADLAGEAEPGHLLELCAGAGHIGLAAAVLSGRDLVQVEADPVAAGYAVTNAERAGWADRVEVRNQRLEVAMHPGEGFPVIIADPPYLPSAEISRWPQDPTLAIDGGHDGLDLIKACLDVAARHLSKTGHLLLQIAGVAQDRQVADLLHAAPELGLRRRDVRIIDAERAVLLVDRATAPY